MAWLQSACTSTSSSSPPNSPSRSVLSQNLSMSPPYQNCASQAYPSRPSDGRFQPVDQKAVSLESAVLLRKLRVRTGGRYRIEEQILGVGRSRERLWRRRRYGDLTATW